jgi:hypothetical protein
MQSSALKNAITISKVLWLALLSSHCVISFVVFTGMFAQSSRPREANFELLLIASAVILFVTFGLYKKMTNITAVKGSIQHLDLSQILNNQKNVSPEIIAQLSEEEKLKYVLIIKTQIKAIMCWAVCEFALIIGFVGFVLGFVPDQLHFASFPLMSISAMVLMFPKFTKEIVELRL